MGKGSKYAQLVRAIRKLERQLRTVTSATESIYLSELLRTLRSQLARH